MSTQRRKSKSARVKLSRAPVEPAQEPVETPKTPREKLDIIKYVASKYISGGWTIIYPQKGAINDLLVQKGARVQFVQVVTDELLEGARHSDVAKNTFIQNAFSNAADPIYATVSVSKAGVPSVRFENVNTNTRVVIAKAVKTAAE
jgi:hypothetical protein